MSELSAALIIILYARVSTEEQARSGTSLDDQLEACRARAEQLAAAMDQPVAIVEIRDDFGGDVLERPKLQQALDLVRTKRVSHWITLNPDRFSRKLTLQLLVADDIERAGCQLVFTDYHYDQTPEGTLFFQIRGAVSQFEKAKILERMTRGARSKAKAGGIPNRIQLYGYRQVVGAGKVKAIQALVPDELESRWLRAMYAWCVEELMGGAGIAKRLNELGVPTKVGGGKRWTNAVTNRMMRREVYATGRLILQRLDGRGLARVRRLPKEERRRQGIKLNARPKPPDAWVTVQVEPLIPPDLWQRAQEVLAMHRRGRRAANRPGHHLLLSGLGRCGLCGQPLYYYGLRIACNSQYAHYRSPGIEPCALASKRRHMVEAAVLAEVRCWLKDPETAARAAAQREAEERSAARAGDQAGAGIREELSAVEEQIRAHQEEQARWAQLFARPPRGYNPNRALSELERLGAEVESLESRAKVLRKGLSAAPPPRAASVVLQLLSDPAWREETLATWDALTDARRMQLVRQMVGGYVLHPSPKRLAARVTVIPR